MRNEVLCPPPGSRSHNFSEHLDIGSPSWTSRAANEKEETESGRLGDKKQLVAGQLGERKDVDTKDMKDSQPCRMDSGQSLQNMVVTKINAGTYILQPRIIYRLSAVEKNAQELSGSLWWCRVVFLGSLIGDHSQKALRNLGTVHRRLPSRKAFASVRHRVRS